MKPIKSDRVALRRALSLPVLTFYGLGTILGAGIYVLVGEVAVAAGSLAPIAFLLAAVVAGFSACSFAELSSRLPVCAGEVAYVARAFNRHGLTAATGWAVVIVGILSSATLLNGFSGYAQVWLPWPPWLIEITALVIMTLFASIGIQASARAVVAITLIEIGGLLWVIGYGGSHFLLQQENALVIPSPATGQWLGVFAGAYLAFYAFIGFEDIVNMAEETKDASRNVPRAVLFSLIAATLFYLAVSWVVVLTVPTTELANTGAPLALVFKGIPFAPHAIALIGMIAVVNGVLVQMVMVARVVFGMTREAAAPLFLGQINSVTRTPLRATLLAAVAILLLALFFSLVNLAAMTSMITLAIFSLVNLSLIKLKHVEATPSTHIHFPIWVPMLGFLLSIGLLLFAIIQ